MHNSTDGGEIHYSTHHEEHRGYRIYWASTRSQSEQGKYLGHFRAMKDGESTLRATLGKPLETESDAKNEAVDFAKAKIDEVTEANG